MKFQLVERFLTIQLYFCWVGYVLVQLGPTWKAGAQDSGWGFGEIFLLDLGLRLGKPTASRNFKRWQSQGQHTQANYLDLLFCSFCYFLQAVGLSRIARGEVVSFCVPGVFPWLFSYPAIVHASFLLLCAVLCCFWIFRRNTLCFRN